jgi:fatty acid CoA ligase FadD9
MSDNFVTLSAENLAMFERSIARGRGLLEADPGLAQAMPSIDAFQRVVDRRTSIEIVEAIAETYAERPAVGRRAYEIVVDPMTRRRIAKFVPAFETIRYRDLWARIVRLASGLKNGGIAGAGDIVTLVGFTTVDHLVAELACHYLQAVSVPLAKNVGARELELIANECESATLFSSLEQLKTIVRSISRCPSIKTLVAIDVIAEDDRHLEAIEIARAAIAVDRPDVEIATIADIEARGAAASDVRPEIPREGTDPLLSIVYTSGSTGAPKGAMFRERSWHARWATLPFLELTALPMVSVVFLPQNHMGGRNAVANSLKVGGLAYFTHESDMSTLFEDIRIVRPTYIHLVPRISETIHQRFQSESAKRDRAEVMEEMRRTFLGDRMLLALTASAPTPIEVSAFIKRCFDIPIVDVFSGTEYGQLFIDGRVNRHNVLELKLVSVPELGYFDTDTPYPRGELLVKTARAIASYFKNEKATEALFDASGFMRTGDIFEQRGLDQMEWIDRKNNVLKLSQGEFVNVWKLEALFSTGSRFIKQIYIQGDSTRSYLLAVIVPEMSEIADEATTTDVLRAELNRLAIAHGLEPYETPRDFIVEREPFSRDNGLWTSVNKPARPKLKEKYGPAIGRLYDELDRRASARLSTPEDGAQPIAVRVERTIAATLGLAADTLDARQSFRSFGGDSIAATNLCAIAERDFGVRLSVGFVLGSETSLADISSAIEAHASRRVSVFERIHGANPELIEARALRLERFFRKQIARRGGDAHLDSGSKSVLLTGATGFLGRFLCFELLRRAWTAKGKVYCVVRAKSDADALRRLTQVFGPGSGLHVGFQALVQGRLVVLAGDLEKADFGWPSDQYRRLSEEIDTIVHAAALVNHALPYAQLFEANVLGTVEAIRFAVEGRRKRFNQVSTNSVSLALLGDREVALETDDTRTLGDCWPVNAQRHANGYKLSKWAGEVLAQDLFETFGVPVNVYRCNLILPPARFRGQINAGDFLTRLISSVVHAGIRPRSFYEESAGSKPHLDGFPVDFIAASIAAIATRASREYAVHHVNNVHWNDGVSLDSVMRRLEAHGYLLASVDDYAAWFQSFEKALRGLEPARRAASSLPIIDQWREPLSMAKRKKIDASRFRATVQALRPQGLDDIPHLDGDYFDRCISDMRALGLIGG